MSKQSPPPSKLALEATRLFVGGQHSAAMVKAQQALKIKPTDVEALSIFGLVEASTDKLPNAAATLSRVVELRPSWPEAHFNLACVLQKLKNDVAAEQSYLAAIRLNPHKASYFNNLGSLYQERKQIEPALKYYLAAIEVDPSHEASVINLYGVYRTMGAMPELEQLTRDAVRRWPTTALHWTARAEALFFLGRLVEAWKCYEWRFKAVDLPALSRAQPGLAVWQGQDLSDMSLLVWTEQGPGDEIMYGSLIPEIRSRVKKLSVLCSARMRPVFERTIRDVQFFGDTVPDDAISTIDMQATIVAFAPHLRPELSSFFYCQFRLAHDRVLSQKLRAQYQGPSQKILIGIAWRSAGVEHAKVKSINLGVWGALFALPGVQFVNLQYGDCSKEIATIKTAYGAEVINDTMIDPLRDLDSYAAQVGAMDVVVCSSNTAAHFAGALGVKTLCMVPRTPGLGLRWYWQENAGVSLWYDKVQLFRQLEDGSWLSVVRDVTISLAQYIFDLKRLPEIPGFLLRLASGYATAGQRVDAVRTLEALATIPGQGAHAFFELASIAKAENRNKEAEELLDQSLQHDPTSIHALNLKGVMTAARGEYNIAEQYYLRALNSDPLFFEALNNIGTVVRRMGRGREAHEYYVRANQLQPNHQSVLLNLATNLNEIGSPSEAIPFFDQLLALNPEYVEARHSRSFALLSAGRFAEGWAQLWCRHQVIQNDERPPDDRPARWSGQDLAGRSLFVWTEQGLGDEILAVSMLPDAVKLAKKMTLMCSARMVKLFQRSFPGITVIDRSQLSGLNLAEFDYQLSQSELGAAFRPSTEAFARAAPFLSPDRAAVAAIEKRYRGSRAPVNIGISWASANPETGVLKGLDLLRLASALRELSERVGPLNLISLQYGDHKAEVDAVQKTLNVEISQDPNINPMQDVDAFAAQVAAMDFVITISNTTAHMAGALGVPTVLLLPSGRGRHWYWFSSNENCLWYPNIKFVFQSADGTWDNALTECREYLSCLIRNPLRPNDAGGNSIQTVNAPQGDGQ